MAVNGLARGLQDVQERTSRERGRVPEAVLTDPGFRLIGVRGVQDDHGRTALEDAAERETARPAHLDEDDLRHVEIAHGTLDDRHPARAVEHDGHELPWFDEVTEAARRVRRPDTA